MKMLDKCIDVLGDYVEKENGFQLIHDIVNGTFK